MLPAGFMLGGPEEERDAALLAKSCMLKVQDEVFLTDQPTVRNTRFNKYGHAEAAQVDTRIVAKRWIINWRVLDNE
jgi:hypothetical protein